MKPLAAMVIVGAFVATAGLVGASGAGTSPKLKFLNHTGPTVYLAPGQVSEILHVDCPAGFLATGGGVGNGALTTGASVPSPDGRGWTGILANYPDSTSVYSGYLSVRCARGAFGLKVAQAASLDALRHARRDLLRAIQSK